MFISIKFEQTWEAINLFFTNFSTIVTCESKVTSTRWHVTSFSFMSCLAKNLYFQRTTFLRFFSKTQFRMLFIRLVYIVSNLNPVLTLTVCLSVSRMSNRSSWVRYFILILLYISFNCRALRVYGVSISVIFPSGPLHFLEADACNTNEWN